MYVGKLRKKHMWAIQMVWFYSDQLRKWCKISQQSIVVENQSKLLPAVNRVHFDDVGFVIRQSNPDITEWMDKMGFKQNYSLLEQYYEQK